MPSSRGISLTAGITDAGRVSELVPLEKMKRSSELQGNTTEAGKKKLQEINSQKLRR